MWLGGVWIGCLCKVAHRRKKQREVPTTVKDSGQEHPLYTGISKSTCQWSAGRPRPAPAAQNAGGHGRLRSSKRSHGHDIMTIAFQPGGSAVKEMAGGIFKAQCLAIMDQVLQSGEPVLITKHGKPVAKLVPAE